MGDAGGTQGRCRDVEFGHAAYRRDYTTGKNSHAGARQHPAHDRPRGDAGDVGRDPYLRLAKRRVQMAGFGGALLASLWSQIFLRSIKGRGWELQFENNT